MQYELQYTLDFGKYKGRVLEDIIEHDITYVQWCLTNIDEFELVREARLHYDILIEEHEYNQENNIKEKTVNERFKSNKNPFHQYMVEQCIKGNNMKKIVLMQPNNNKNINTDINGKFIPKVDCDSFSYFTDLDITEDDLGKHFAVDGARGMSIAQLVKWEGLSPREMQNADAWIICPIDIDTHMLRLEKQKKAQEIMNILDEEVKKTEKMMIFQTMAAKNPRMNQLMHELNSLDNTLMPSEMLPTNLIIGNESVSEEINKFAQDR